MLVGLQRARQRKATETVPVATAESP